MGGAGCLIVSVFLYFIIAKCCIFFLHTHNFLYFIHSFIFGPLYCALTVFTADTAKCYRNKLLLLAVVAAAGAVVWRIRTGIRIMAQTDNTHTHWSEASCTMRSSHVSLRDNYSALVWLGCLNMIWNIITSRQLFPSIFRSFYYHINFCQV